MGDELSELEAMKLIRSAHTTQMTYGASQETYFDINYAGQPAKFRFNGNTLHQLIFTRAGRELRNLMNLTENKDYTQELLDRFKGDFKPPT